MDPVRIIIIGATGDLAKKKLYRALFDLYRQGNLPEDLDIIGAARSNLTDESFRHLVKGSIPAGDEKAPAFLARCRYCAGDFAEQSGYSALAAMLAESQRCIHTLFYLAVSPDLYASIFDGLSHSGLAIPCVREGGIESWVRIAVEKPFGRDLTTAQALEEKLCASFAEGQVFRIDHYLAKESIENILAFRFGNCMFEPIWNNQYIESVHARLLEPFGIEGRGMFYDGIGALSDVGQNHLLQMLAVIALEPPGNFDAEGIQQARAAVLSRLVCDGACGKGAVKGQYASYAKEAGVKEDSMTETYFKVTAAIDTPRFKGVPFILESGKKMAEQRVDITVRFKTPQVFNDDVDHQIACNEVVFSISPKETIAIKFMAKKPGFGFTLTPKYLSFMYDDGSPDAPRDAYEKLLYDAILGNRTLFLSNQEVEHSWRFITAITDAWKDMHPLKYADDTPGPITKESLIS